MEQEEFTKIMTEWTDLLPYCIYCELEINQEVDLAIFPVEHFFVCPGCHSPISMAGFPEVNATHVDENFILSFPASEYLDINLVRNALSTNKIASSMMHIFLLEEPHKCNCCGTIQSLFIPKCDVGFLNAQLVHRASLQMN